VLALVLSLSLSPALLRYPDWRVFDSLQKLLSKLLLSQATGPSALCHVRSKTGVPCIQNVPHTCVLVGFSILKALFKIASTSSSSENGPLDDTAHGSSLLQSYRLHSSIQSWPRLQTQRSLAVDIHTHTIGLTWIVKSYIRGELTISRRKHANATSIMPRLVANHV
jgi:hypothetical protein